MTRRNLNKKARLSAPTDEDEANYDEVTYNGKMKVDCICPKCGKKHVMVFCWIGRGIPRKYCPSCKGRYDD